MNKIHECAKAIIDRLEPRSIDGEDCYTYDWEDFEEILVEFFGCSNCGDRPAVKKDRHGNEICKPCATGKVECLCCDDRGTVPNLGTCKRKDCPNCTADLKVVRTGGGIYGLNGGA